MRFAFRPVTSVIPRAGLRLLACIALCAALLLPDAHAAEDASPYKPWESGVVEPLLPDFDPSLTSVTLAEAPTTRTITRSGKGWLETTTDTTGVVRRVLVVRGTPYEMGVQQGELLKTEVQGLVNTILVTVGAVETLRTGEQFADRLRAIQKRCGPFIPPAIIEEARGLAKGAGLTEEAVLLANIFPELFHCSGFAVWGEATADGRLYHGRILDYMTQLGLQQVAVVAVHVPEGKIPFVTVGYAGFLGSVTGMNTRGISIGEMGGGGQGKWDGMPMTYLVRTALEDASTLDEALAIFRDTPRTCEYYYVVSDGKIPSARGLCATPEQLDVVKPGERHERLPHPVKDAVLLSAGDRYKRLVMRTEANYGKLGPGGALALMRRPVAMESCLHTVLMRPDDGTLWVANASKFAQPASEQSYAEYSLPELLARE